MNPARKRILYYSHTRQVSGGERVLLTMLEVLDRTRYEAVCACPFDGKGELDEVLSARGEQVVEAPVLQARFTTNPLKLAGYLASFAGAVLAFRKTVVRTKPDLLHANSVRAGIVATLATAGTGTMVLWHIHDDLPEHPATSAIRQLAFRSARSRFVAVSHATARVFAGGMPFGYRLQVLHNAVDTGRFPRKSSPLDAAAQRVRDALLPAGGGALVVAVGMINPRKGLLELVSAWESIMEDFPAEPALQAAQAAPHLALVGAPIFNQDHLYEERVRKAAVGVRNVHFPGPSADVPALLRAADLLVLNAVAEPFGLVVLEAIASGTAVVATAVGGIPEIVVDQQTAYLVPPASRIGPKAREELSGAISLLLRHPEAAARLAGNAFSQALPQFTVAVFAGNLQALYTSLLAGEGSV